LVVPFMARIARSLEAVDEIVGEQLVIEEVVIDV
jgi:hypothetical protein